MPPRFSSSSPGVMSTRAAGSPGCIQSPHSASSALPVSSYRTIIRCRRRCSPYAACISKRRRVARTSWCAASAGRSSTSRSMSATARRPIASGSLPNCRPRTATSCYPDRLRARLRAAPGRLRGHLQMLGHLRAAKRRRHPLGQRRHRLAHPRRRHARTQRQRQEPA